MTLVLAYARERLTPGRLVPAVLLVVLATLAGRGWTGPLDATEDAAIALALVVSFRMWDDLMDRERDRVKHPDRALVRASSLAPVRVVSWIIGLAALVSIDLIKPWATVLRNILATSMPGSRMLWTYSARPVTLSRPSVRSTERPIWEPALVIAAGVSIVAISALRSHPRLRARPAGHRLA